MRVAILEQHLADRTATGTRGRAIAAFLGHRGHEVERLAPSPARVRDFHRFRFSLWSRLKRRALGRRSLPHLWDYLADDLERQIRRGRFDVIIARLQSVAYVLTRDLAALKIFDMANIGFLEMYHGWSADLCEVDQSYAKEMETYRAADYILSPHPLLTDFFRRHVFDDPKVVTVRLGCDRAARRATHSAPPRIVYAGSYDYIQDPYLLALLTRASPFAIHCYGPRDPNHAFLPARLDYRGYAPTVDFLADYQFGLITVSTDRLRRYSPATKFAYYFAHGLPVLFPEWMQEGHTYEAAIPYREETFVDEVRRIAGDEPRWHELSERAIAIADGLAWERVLTPLDDILDAARAGATRAGSRSGRPVSSG